MISPIPSYPFVRPTIRVEPIKIRSGDIMIGLFARWLIYNGARRWLRQHFDATSRLHDAMLSWEFCCEVGCRSRESG